MLLEDQFDLLTAALIGVAVGVGATMLLRRGPSGSRPIVPAARAAGRGARWAGEHGLTGARWASEQGLTGAKWAGKRGSRGARWAADQAEDLWDRVPAEDIQETVGEYLSAAKETVEDAVQSELRDLRKAIRKQRKRLGV